jgi:hypothetical protein
VHLGFKVWVLVFRVQGLGSRVCARVHVRLLRVGSALWGLKMRRRTQELVTDVAHPAQHTAVVAKIDGRGAVRLMRGSIGRERGGVSGKEAA